MTARRLQFQVHRCSSHQPGYPPQNVLVDRPSDQSSRWSTDDSTVPQFLTLRLPRPAVVETIAFGKYGSKHIANLKKFTVVGGMRDEHFTKLLAGGLENTSAKETFPLRHITDCGQPFPIQYISIVPQLSWGPSFNFSIWYIELHGIDDPDLVAKLLFQYNLRAERETIKICLKHFRQQKYSAAFDELQKQTGVTLEAPRLTLLYRLLVERGDFDGAENLLQKSAKEGLFNWYASQQPYEATWNNVSPCSPELIARLTEDSPPGSPPLTTSLTPRLEDSEIEKDRPGQRGGHQMCMDPVTNTIYLFGGWDGENDLSDLWSYNVLQQKWTLIFKYSEQCGGPNPRSCHKMVLDSNNRKIYLFGRYLDTKNRTAENAKSDLYSFDITEWCWTKICEDTSTCEGPPLIFDHQMCIDVDKHIIYVFGGKILQPSIEGEESSPQYSGLYAYFICEDKWQLLLPDLGSVDSINMESPSILSRAGHSMLYHPITKTLYIFGGQRNKEHQADFLSVSVDGIVNHETSFLPVVQSVCTAAPPKRSPPTGFTQRATIDPELNEIYVLSGLSKEKDKRVSNSLWVFSINNSQWSCIYKNDNQGQKYWAKMQVSEPCPRFAHQLIYDPSSKIHYLFGGNPGRSGQPRLRLDDFWLLKLSRINSTSALWRARLQLRRLRFQELAEAGKAHEALAYLQTHIYQATDHSDPEQERQFQLLATMLFSEKMQDVIFNPPLDGVGFGATPPSPAMDCRSDPRDLNRDDSSEYSSPESEQQALFAAVLGMESSNAESPIETSCDFDYGTSGRYFESEDDIHELSDVKKERWNRWGTHYRRCQLFQQLSDYYPQHMVQPKKNLTDYIVL